jgi:alpha-amylase
LILEEIMKRIILLLLLAAVLTACASPSVGRPTLTPAKQGSWWEEAIFYEIFVRSFYDSDGDGIGDFNGITEKLDYIQALGVNAIWLMPIHPSPTYHGYDVINYFNVNPDYGTMDDFKHLLDEVHKRGMYLIIDLVINHTSSQSPWFVDANNNPNSAYRNWYNWSNTDPGYTGPIGYPWHQGKQGFYYGIFSATMPDLNYTNPQVSAEMLKIVKFWLDFRVDGFRVDAVKYLIEEGKNQQNTASTHAWLEKFYTAYKADNPNAYTVGEVTNAGAFIAKTYERQLDEIFNFDLAGGFLNSAQGESTSSINSAFKFTLTDLPNGPYGTFLTNHDQNRVMSMMSGNVEKAKVAAGMFLTAPGTPFIYYGEEIGMEGVKPDENIRRPMQWDGTANAGFTTGSPWRSPGDNYKRANVTTETADPNSLLSFYRTLIRLRNQHPALKSGSFVLGTTNNSGVYSGLRIGTDEKILVVINLTKSSISDYNITFQDPQLQDGTYKLIALYGEETTSPMIAANHTVNNFTPLAELAAYGITIYNIVP